MIGCEQFEILLADYIDGELESASRAADRIAFLRHMKSPARPAPRWRKKP